MAEGTESLQRRYASAVNHLPRNLHRYVNIMNTGTLIASGPARHFYPPTLAYHQKVPTASKQISRPGRQRIISARKTMKNPANLPEKNQDYPLSTQKSTTA